MGKKRKFNDNATKSRKCCCKCHEVGLHYWCTTFFLVRSCYYVKWLGDLHILTEYMPSFPVFVDVVGERPQLHL